MKKRYSFFILILTFLFIICLSISTEESKNINKNDKNKCEILNGDFSNDLSNWVFWTNNGTAGSIKNNDGKAEIIIKKSGNRVWFIGLNQGGILLEKDYVYNLSFEASSEDNLQITISLGMAESPYYRYSGDRIYKLSNQIKKYSFNFTMWQKTDNNGYISIHLGNIGIGKVTIDNIKITKLKKRDELIIPKNYIKPDREMKRGIQFGNCLDAPHEGAWEAELDERYFDLIKNLDYFDHIRLPVCWETHTEEKAPYKIDPDFIKRVDWAVSHALKRGFYVIINMHHHVDFEKNPFVNRQKFLSIWKQIAEYFKDYPEWLYFEIYNEPQLELDKYWNEYYPQVYKIIRESNPTRKIIITGPFWGNADHLSDLKIPKFIKDDPNIMVEFHFYHPYKFCFQNSLGNGAEDINGIRWRGSKSEKKEITDLLDFAVKWAEKNNVKLWNGEFGAHKYHPYEEDRLKWINFVITECEKRNIPWTYWDFCGNGCFIYNIHTDEWDKKLLDAMIINNYLNKND